MTKNVRLFPEMWAKIVILFVVIHKCTPGVVFTENEEVFYQIAGIFEQEAKVPLKAFNESLRYANSGALRIQPLMMKPFRTDSYSIWRELCSNEDIRPIVMFGPQNPITDGAIRDQCALAHIPHIQATWQPNDPDKERQEDPTNDEEVSYYFEDLEPDEVTENNEVSTNEEPEFKKITINFYPDSDELAMAYSQLLKYYNWENFAVLYEDDFGLLRIQKILANHTEKFPVTVRRLDSSGSNYKIFKELIKYQESRFLVDCHADRVKKYMDEANALNMVNHYQHYILVSMDTSRYAEELTQYHSNITWLSITDYDKLKDSQHFLSQRVGRWVSKTETIVTTSVTTVETEALLMDDIANHVLKALKNLSEEVDIRFPTDPPCADNPWYLGAAFQKQILETKSKGVSGNIEFDDQGKRVNYTLYINEIYVTKRNTIGRWESATGLIQEDKATDSTGLQQTSKHFIVISRKAKPYFYNKNKTDTSSEVEAEDDGDEEYEGFSVDLVKEIFKILTKEMNFNYTYSFSREEHFAYGKLDPKTKKWTGLIGDLLDKKADLAVCDLTITEERKKVVDFSVPIMTLGISILYTKERKVTPGTFSFLNPYSFEVWIYTGTAYCLVSIILFVCSRISPADWENPQPCDKDPEELENIWNFKNCAWLTMGSIMTQGCDILPKAVGSRWVCGMWWFFAMIVCQTYIAQLAASMSSALANEPIDSIEDLAKHNKILYGALGGGSTLEFFKNSKDKMFHRMYENMISNDVVLVRDNDEGEKRVLNGKNKYAFFMESSTIAYKLKRNCDLKQVGNELDSKDYGIAMPANSPFRSQINRAILKLKERTKLDEIKEKWWEKKYGAKECLAMSDKSDVEGDLEMDNLMGAFLVLFVGLVFCVFISVAEFLNEVRNIVVREQVSHKEAFIQELKASLNLFQLQKPVLRNPSRAPSIASIDSDDRHRLRAAAVNDFADMEKMQQ